MMFAALFFKRRKTSFSAANAQNNSSHFSQRFHFKAHKPFPSSSPRTKTTKPKKEHLKHRNRSGVNQQNNRWENDPLFKPLSDLFHPGTRPFQSLRLLLDLLIDHKFWWWTVVNGRRCAAQYRVARQHSYRPSTRSPERNGNRFVFLFLWRGPWFGSESIH